MDPLILKNAVRVSICHTVIANGFMQVMMLLINRCMTHANLQWDNLETWKLECPGRGATLETKNRQTVYFRNKYVLYTIWLFSDK